MAESDAGGLFSILLLDLVFTMTTGITGIHGLIVDAGAGIGAELGISPIFGAEAHAAHAQTFSSGFEAAHAGHDHAISSVFETAANDNAVVAGGLEPLSANDNAFVGDVC